MTIETTTVDIEELDSALASAAPKLSRAEQRLAVAIYRMLAAPPPVTVGSLAATTGIDAADVEQALRSWTGVFRDDAGAVVGFWGLAREAMPHRLLLADATRYAWCAWDPLFLAHVVGPIDVATPDPVTGEAIGYHIAADGVISDLTHPDAVLSFLAPVSSWDDDVMATFCHYVLQFTGPDTAREWTSRHAGTFILRQGDAVKLARRHVARTFGDAVSALH